MRNIELYEISKDNIPVKDFIDTLDDEVREKVFYVFDFIENNLIVSKKFFKKLEGTKKLWEIRVEYAGNIYRFLGFMHKGGLVLLNHAFQKKSQKTPKSDINLAASRMSEYLRRCK